MKNYFLKTQIFIFLAILLFCTACKGQVKKEFSEEKVQPKLIKTIGSPRYGNVQCSLQDKAGNLWFGTTQNGLYKYDGKQFSRFLEADGLNSNNISSLLEDKVGKIWIGTDSGLCLYDPAILHKTGNKTFTEINLPLPLNPAPNKDDPYYSSQWVYSIMQTRNGKLWFVTRGGVYIYNGNSFTTFTITEASNGIKNSDFKPERILEDKAGNLWFGGRSSEGVYRYDGKSITKLKPMDLFQNGPKPRAHNWGWPQLQDKNGNIWFSNWGGAYKYDGNSFTGFSKKDGLPGIVTSIVEDKSGNLWFGGDGLCRYDARLNDEVGQGQAFTYFTTTDGMPDLGIWSILEDTSGNLWVGTRETGLYLYNGKTFITYSEYKQ